MEFRVKGIKIRFTFLFFWILTLFCLVDRSGILFWGVLAAIIHELGHIIAFLLVGDFPEELSFELTGIKMVRSGKAITPGKEIFQLFMGSGANFLVFFILSYSLQTVNKISLFAVSHLILGVFNLLPIQTLDGGMILKIINERIFGIRTAYVLGKVISFVILIPLLCVGCYLCVLQRFHFSLLFVCIWLLVACIKQ